MATTLTYLTATLDLPPDLLWSDEFSWNAVVQRKQYSITGALVVESHAKQSGRPITLESGDGAWMRRSTLEALKAWEATAGARFSLVLRGEASRLVAFDRETSAIEATQINTDYDSTSADDLFTVTLRFIEVPA